MNVNAIMHVAFYTDHMDEMIDFYVNKLGFTYKYDVKYSFYLDRDDRPQLQEAAKKYPDRLFNVYIEVTDGQFIELFPAHPNQKNHTDFNEHKGYSHFAITVDDIFEVKKELESKGVEIDSAISKGPSETYQMWVHDPDGNKFEIMQFTEKSLQLGGNK